MLFSHSLVLLLVLYSFPAFTPLVPHKSWRENLKKSEFTISHFFTYCSQSYKKWPVAEGERIDCSMSLWARQAILNVTLNSTGSQRSRESRFNEFVWKVACSTRRPCEVFSALKPTELKMWDIQKARVDKRAGCRFLWPYTMIALAWVEIVPEQHTC